MFLNPFNVCGTHLSNIFVVSKWRVSFVYVIVTSLFSVVFMGSEKYPDENDFKKYIEQHGGFCNAATGCERVRWLAND